MLTVGDADTLGVYDGCCVIDDDTDTVLVADAVSLCDDVAEADSVADAVGAAEPETVAVPLPLPVAAPVVDGDGGSDGDADGDNKLPTDMDGVSDGRGVGDTDAVELTDVVDVAVADTVRLPLRDVVVDREEVRDDDGGAVRDRVTVGVAENDRDDEYDSDGVTDGVARGQRWQPSVMSSTALVAASVSMTVARLYDRWPLVQLDKPKGGGPGAPATPV